MGHPFALGSHRHLVQDEVDQGGYKGDGQRVVEHDNPAHPVDVAKIQVQQVSQPQGAERAREGRQAGHDERLPGHDYDEQPPKGAEQAADGAGQPFQMNCRCAEWRPLYRRARHKTIRLRRRSNSRLEQNQGQLCRTSCSAKRIVPT